MMKRVVAYVNTLRVHWLVEELQKIGISEIMVMEYFAPLSQISRFEFLCEEAMVESMQSIVHRIGTAGNPPDHFVDVTDFDQRAFDDVPLGRRICILENG